MEGKNYYFSRRLKQSDGLT